jgi:hypothetical protein
VKVGTRLLLPIQSIPPAKILGRPHWVMALNRLGQKLTEVPPEVCRGRPHLNRSGKPAVAATILG